MIIPRATDAIHKAWLYRLLIYIADNPVLMEHLRFKGGTCAAMLGWLDRFSVDLDFDLIHYTDQHITVVKKELENIFTSLHLNIKDASTTGVQYFLKYEAPVHQRNTIKIDSQFPPPAHNIYDAYELVEIDRTLACQTIETMFANKLVAVLDRWETHQSIAGRDIYDIHHFFINNHTYNPAVILERRGTSPREFLIQLCDFIEKHITRTIIQQDLNVLLPPDQFTQIQKSLKPETLIFLRDELKRI